MTKDGYKALVLAAVSACLFAPAAAGAGEHREILAELRSDTATWRQPRLNEGYPMGCGPTAWAIVYAYWAQHHAANGLFPGGTIDTTSAGSSSAPVMAVMENVAGLVQTEWYEKSGPVRDREDETIFEHGGRVKVGSTNAYDMCPGIGYAKQNGFPHSQCFRILGSEFDKFDHVRRHLEADRPVILNISTKGHKATNHYVVAEKVKKIQERVAGQWRDRDIEYYVNYGWGGNRNDMPEWLSARQVGVDTSQVYTVTHIYLINLSTTPLMATDANHEACLEWCEGGDGHQAGCDTCSKLPGCGASYKHLTSFTGAGANWYACAARDTRRADASEGHREECEAWCRSNPECKTCSTLPGCGIGARPIKSWTGFGKNWYACAERGQTQRQEASEDHQNDCQQWCRSNPECVKCSDQLGCGIGFETLKSWTGFGKNWYACAQTARQEASDQHKADCEAWCQANPGCEMCSTLPQCGVGYEPLRGWTGRGRNWYACGKRQSFSDASRDNKQECEDWCRTHSGCSRCSTNVGCGIGYKNVKSFTGRGQNWYACEKR